MAKTCAACGERPALMAATLCKECHRESSESSHWDALVQANEHVLAVLRTVAPDVQWAHVGVGYIKESALKNSWNLWVGRYLFGILGDLLASTHAQFKSLILTAISTDERLFLISLGETPDGSIVNATAEPAIVLAKPLGELHLKSASRGADREAVLVLTLAEENRLRLAFPAGYVAGNKNLPFLLFKRRNLLTNSAPPPIVGPPLTEEASRRLLNFWRSTWLAWRSGQLDELSPGFRKAAKGWLGPFIVATGSQHYPVSVVLRDRDLDDTEVLVACTPLDPLERIPLEFVLTSHRLLVYDHRDGEFAELAVDDIAGLDATLAPDRKSYHLDVRLTNGEKRTFDSLVTIPLEKGLSMAAALFKQAQMDSTAKTTTHS